MVRSLRLRGYEEDGYGKEGKGYDTGRKISEELANVRFIGQSG